MTVSDLNAAPRFGNPFVMGSQTVLCRKLFCVEENPKTIALFCKGHTRKKKEFTFQ